jgi:hypothetical protein
MGFAQRCTAFRGRRSDNALRCPAAGSDRQGIASVEVARNDARAFDAPRTRG